MRQFGIIAPLTAEASCIARSRVQPDKIIRLGDNIFLYVSGIGPERAESAVRQLVSHGCNALVSFGTAGALINGLEAGDLLLPESIAGPGGRKFQTSRDMRLVVANKLKDFPRDIYFGQLADSRCILQSPQEKSAFLAANSGALAVDMESAAIGSLAAELDMPFMAIRVVCDTSRTAIPGQLTNFTDRYGRLRPGRFMAHVIRNPGLIPEMVALAAKFRRASNTMKWIGARIKEIL